MHALTHIPLGCSVLLTAQPRHAALAVRVPQLPLASPRDSLGCPGRETPAPGGNPSRADAEAASAKIASSISWAKPEELLPECCCQGASTSALTLVFGSCTSPSQDPRMGKAWCDVEVSVSLHSPSLGLRRQCMVIL